MTAPTANTANRTPPHSKEAEQSVLGSMLRDNRTIDDLAPMLRVGHFYEDANQKIYSAITAIHARDGRAVDVVLLAEELKQRGQIEDIGGYPYLHAVWGAAPTAANAGYYAEIVREKAKQRAAGHLSVDLARMVEDGNRADEIVEYAERVLLELSDPGSSDSSTLDDALNEAADAIDDRARNSGELGGLSTGLADLDDQLAGLRAGELVVAAARPSVGKTALAFQIAAAVAIEQRKRVMFVSLEQSRGQLAERLLCARGRVDSFAMRMGKLQTKDYAEVQRVMSCAKAAQLRIVTKARRMLHVASEARRMKRKEGLDLLVVDYLQLIDPEDSRANRTEQVGTVARRLQALSRELEIPVLVLCQLNRAVETRPGKRPILADLRDSGEIEQHADVVLLLHKTEDPPAGPYTRISLEVAKNRNGPTGRMGLAFHGPHIRFDPLDESMSFESPFVD